VIGDPVVIPYREIPHFVVSTAPGHKGQFVCGELGGRTVICMQGRLHYYEGHSFDDVIFPIRVMKLLGVKTLIAIYKRPDLVFNASACGDNCAKWMLAMCGEEDRTINLYHLMSFGEGPFQIRILNTDTIVRNGNELFFTASRFTG
jgi:hypothetical protein